MKICAPVYCICPKHRMETWLTLQREANSARELLTITYHAMAHEYYRSRNIRLTTKKNNHLHALKQIGTIHIFRKELQDL